MSEEKDKEKQEEKKEKKIEEKPMIEVDVVEDKPKKDFIKIRKLDSNHKENE